MIRAALAKDLASLWTSPVPWVAGAVLQAVLAVLFVDQMQGRLQAVVQPLFPIAGLLLVVTVPVIAMRAFAEERRSANLDVLLAAPVPVLPLATGKWLAAWLTSIAVLAPASVLALLTMLWGDPDDGPIIAGFLGLVLLASALAAAGVAASAATSSQALAALVTILAGLVLWFVGSATSGSSTARLLGSVSLSERLRTFAAGGIDSGDVAFFVGVTAVAVVVAACIVRFRVVLAVAAVGLAVATAWASGTHDLVDLSEQSTLTLTSVTLDVLDAVTDDVSITAYIARGAPGRVEAVTLLDRYARRSRHLDVDVVDPADAPADAQAFGIDPVLGGIVVQRGDEVELAAGPTEQDVTSALARVVRGTDARLCLTTGHGEVALEALGERLSALGYALAEVDLLAGGVVDGDCDVVVVASPEEQPPLDDLREWLDDDGSVLVLADPVSATSYDELLEPYGLALRRGVVFEGDPGSVVNGDEASPIVRRYSSSHPIVRGLAPTYFPGAQAVVIDDAPGVPGLTVSRLADTSETSYLETEPLTPSFDPGDDLGGPITVAAAADRSSVNGRSRLVVIGDVDLASDDLVGAAANGRFLQQAVAWLALEDDLLALSSNLPLDRPLELTDARVAYARVLGVVLVPGLLLIGGGLVWAVRRRR